MIKQLIFLLFIISLVSACDVGNNADEAVWRYSVEFEFVILDGNLNSVIGLDSSQYHPDSVLIIIPQQGDTLSNWFTPCGGSEGIQWFSPKPYTSIDTKTYYVRLTETDYDTIDIYHYYYEPDDFYYKIYIYNGNEFDERLNIYSDNSDGCGDLPTYLIKETK